MNRRLLVLSLVAAVAGPIPTLAADGVVQDVPAGKGVATLSGLAGPSGVVSQDGTTRFVTLLDGPSRTVVARIDATNGKVIEFRTLGGPYEVPAVAYDGTGGGLSVDGRTLMLGRIDWAPVPRATRFLVIDPRRLWGKMRTIGLRGWFSFDAISPDGRTAFLIEYLSPADPTRYRVRAMDVRSGVLRPGQIVDPTEPDEKMTGTPVARAMSADGRWAYTLYDRAGREPFVHALDTVGATARCIDVPIAVGGGVAAPIANMRMDQDGRTLVIHDAGGSALLDTTTFAVRPPPEPATAAATRPAGGGADRTVLAAGIGAGLLAVGGLVTLSRRRRVSREFPGTRR